MNASIRYVSVLYVDSDAPSQERFKTDFDGHFKVFTAASANEGVELLLRENIQVVIAADKLSDAYGVDFLESVIHLNPAPIRILIAECHNVTSLVGAINRGHIFYCATKPWQPDMLKISIENAHEQYLVSQEYRQSVAALLRANEALEFQLRQRLLS